jgi:hypothetical protein
VEPPAPGTNPDPIVIIEPSAPRVTSPSLFPPPADKLTAATGTGGGLDSQGGPQPQAGSQDTHAAGKARNAPLLPNLPFRGGSSSDLYVSAGSSGSSGGFSSLMLAGLVALLAAALQRRGGLLPLTLAPPRCAAFVLCLERPD